jgi:hypothetical protein
VAASYQFNIEAPVALKLATPLEHINAPVVVAVDCVTLTATGVEVPVLDEQVTKHWYEVFTDGVAE